MKKKEWDDIVHLRESDHATYNVLVLRNSRLEIRLGGGEILKSSKSDFFIFEEQQKKIERSKFNKSKCGISFRYSTISFYILSLQTFVCRLYRLKNVEIFAFFCQYMISPPSIFKNRKCFAQIKICNSRCTI